MRRAFTLTELLAVMGIMAILLTLSLGNLLGSQRKSQMNSTLNMLISDLREQRIKAMTGDTEGTGVISSYGIYFGNNEYTVFRGNSYTEGNPANFVIKLDPTLTFSQVTFPARIIVFSAGSGEVLSFSLPNNTITLSDTGDGSTKTITINQYGVPTLLE